MKKGYLFTLIAGAMSFFLFQSFGGDENSEYGGGSPGGYSGSPHDGQNCTHCHNGTATTVSGWIASTVPVSGYLPGTVYTVSVTLSGTGKKGFECSPQAVDGTLLGTLAAGTGTHLVNQNKAVTQNSSPSTNPYTWTFSWTSPAAGTGPVTFYGAFSLGTGTTKLSTLVIPEYTIGFQQLTLNRFEVFPNPATNWFRISYSLNTPQEMIVSLVDLSGKCIMKLFSGNQGKGDHLNDLVIPDDLGRGLYFIKLQSLSETHLEKIIIL